MFASRTQGGRLLEEGTVGFMLGRTSNIDNNAAKSAAVFIDGQFEFTSSFKSLMIALEERCALR